MTDTFEFTLNNPLTEEQWDQITDVDFDNTYRIWFHTKNGKEVEFAKVIRCKDCKHFEYDHFDAVYFPTETGEAERVPLITAHEICTRWGDGCKTDQNGFCFMAERKEHDTDRMDNQP